MLLRDEIRRPCTELQSPGDTNASSVLEFLVVLGKAEVQMSTVYSPPRHI